MIKNYKAMQRLILLMLISVTPLIAGCSTTRTVTTGSSTAGDLYSVFRSLEGNWHSVSPGSGMPPATVNYRTIASGSAVVETVFAGTPHEMISVIYLDGEQLRMTHYCAARNQPHLYAKMIADDSVLFVTDYVSNHDDPAEVYMGEAKWTFSDKNNLTTNWWSFQDGKSGEPMVFNMTRLPD